MLHLKILSALFKITNKKYLTQNINVINLKIYFIW